MRSAAPVHSAPTTFAELVWPASRTGWRAGLGRSAVLVLAGACILVVSAKVQVPGPVPMTLQTLAVLALGAMLGFRLALASVVLYLAEGALGLPVFANTPPLAPGVAYLIGPTGGFLAGFLVAAALVGLAADRGAAAKPVAFGVVLAAASASILACGWAWLAFGMPVHGGSGLGAAKAYAVGIRPFVLGEAVKTVLAALALPLTLGVVDRIVHRP